MTKRSIPRPCNTLSYPRYRRVQTIGGFIILAVTTLLYSICGALIAIITDSDRIGFVGGFMIVLPLAVFAHWRLHLYSMRILWQEVQE